MPGSKIFVGGLSWETSDEVFKDFFSKFGEIEESIIMREKATGNSRGFGFVTYVDSSALDQVLSGDLELEGRKVDCKAAVPRDSVQQTGGGNPGRTTKIFVGGLSSDTTTEGLKNYFTRFGGVAEAIVMMDNTTGRSRGFGFVTFESDDSVEKVIATGDHMINEKGVECKKPCLRHKWIGKDFPVGEWDLVAQDLAADAVATVDSVVVVVILVATVVVLLELLLLIQLPPVTLLLHKLLLHKHRMAMADKDSVVLVAWTASAVVATMVVVFLLDKKVTVTVTDMAKVPLMVLLLATVAKVVVNKVVVDLQAEMNVLFILTDKP